MLENAASAVVIVLFSISCSTDIPHVWPALSVTIQATISSDEQSDKYNILSLCGGYRTLCLNNWEHVSIVLLLMCPYVNVPLMWQ